ncbi:uncharacterized protein LOC101862967 [Aplysia californica]|uniref:Uncharacterized protein LOC101862967 n=1 Tax=Aplysia californica TaxID=6500 RepID=A0ABM0JZV9_APLCA|nr:uncharacterized protein LOC101862967 [Aplysia californica]
MEMSHLYHDGSRGGPTIELDVKEQMRTREVNAREERNFEKKSRTFEKAKVLCEKNTTWERWRVGQTLHTIWERTPRLERSLAIEKARVEALQRAILARSYKRPDNVPVPQPMVIREDVVRSQLTKSAQKKKRRRDRARQRMRRQKAEQEKPLNTDVGVQERHVQKPPDFVKRSEHVVKALARLNWRQETRRRDHLKFKEELEEFSKPVIDRARVVLKGRNDIDVDNMLDKLENYFTPHSNHTGFTTTSRRTQKKMGGSTNTLASKSSQSQSTSSLVGEFRLTEGNLLKLDGGQSSAVGSGGGGGGDDDDDADDPSLLLLSVAASSQTDLTSSELIPDVPNDVVGNRQKNDANSGDVSSPDDHTNKRKTDLSLSSENLTTFTAEEARRISEEFSNVGKDSQTFHLPPIIDGLYGMSLTYRGTEHTKDSKNSTSVKSRHGRSQSQPVHNNSVTSSDAGATNSPTNKDIFSPSTSVSNVILEEDEPEDQAQAGITPSSQHMSQQQTSYFMSRHHNSGGFSDNGNDEIRSTASYALSTVIGLPRVWRQTAAKKKEQPAPDATPSAIARKHRRMRSNPRL